MSAVLAHGRCGADRGARLVSSLDLFRFHAGVYAVAIRKLSELEDSLAGGPQSSPVPDDMAADLKATLNVLQELCVEANLLTAARNAEYAADETRKRTIGQVRENLRAIRFVIERDLAEQFLLRLTTQEAAWFKSESPFGAEVAAAFNSAELDMREAAKCLATERHTACVFHCMRVLEAGLVALAEDVLGRRPGQEQWGNLIESVEKAIETVRKNGIPGVGKDEKNERLRFWSEVAKEFGYFKDGWRNHVAHARTFYDEHSALSVLNHTRAFMAGLAAAGLKE